MIRKSLLAVLVSGLMVSGVQAAEIQPNGYLFGNLGQADYDFGSEFRGAPGSLDEKDTAFKLGVGVQLNPYVGVEFQYVDLGEAVYKEPGFRQTAEVQALGANLVGTLPFDRFKLYGKVGYHRLELDLQEKETGWEDWSATAKDWVTSYAVGATFTLTPQLEIGVEYERYDDVADEFDASVDIDLASIGLRYNF